MDAKTKAEEIYFSYLNVGKGLISDFLAKQCALILVEELIQEHDWKNPISWNVSRKKYWEQVKSEIQKL